MTIRALAAAPQRLAVAATLACVVSTAACGGPGSSSNGAVIADAVARYGYGPAANAPVTYQPNVVRVGGGPNAIRSVSGDGLVYTLDAGASGVGDLKPGKIMFASSEAVGRVLEVQRNGGDVRVVLGPASLTDIFSDANFTADQPVDFNAMTIQDVPDGGDISEPASSTPSAPGPATPSPADAAVMPTVRLASAPQAQTVAESCAGGENPAPPGAPASSLPPFVSPAGVPGGSGTGNLRNLPPPTQSGEFHKIMGEWELTGYKTGCRVGLKVEHTEIKGLMAALDLHLTLDKPHLVTNIKIAHSLPGTAQKVVLYGLTGFGVDIEAGVADGVSDNRKVRLEIPIEIKTPIEIDGIPFTLVIRTAFLVETAFSAKNGNLTASGEYKLDGPLGWEGSTTYKPTLSVEKSLMDSLSGISVGVNGLVLAEKFTFGLELGLPELGAGPFIGLVASVGVTNGSSVGLVQCKGSTVVLTLRGGVALDIPDKYRDALWSRLHSYYGSLANFPKEIDIVDENVFNKSVVQPDVPACRG
jgi:hypothetical protein